jgi:hypothetical protein
VRHLSAIAAAPASIAAARLAVVAALAAVIVAGCSGLASTPPPPTPADFAGIVSFLAAEGIAVENVRTGDAGCDDRQLVGPAISLMATGLDQARPVAVHLYLFRNQQAYDKLRPSVDRCAASFVTDPESFETVDAVPFVAAGQGPWGDAFREALRTALTKAAGG